MTFAPTFSTRTSRINLSGVSAANSFVKEKGEKLLYNGNPIAVDLYEKEPSAERQNANEKQEYIYTVGDRVRVYDSHHNFIGIYQLQENQVLKPYKLFL